MPVELILLIDGAMDNCSRQALISCRLSVWRLAYTSFFQVGWSQLRGGP